MFHPLLFVFKRISLHSSAFLVPLCLSLFSSTSFLHISGKGRNEMPGRGRVRMKESGKEVKNTLVRQCRGGKEIVVAKEGWKFWAVARWRIALYKLAPRVSNLCYQTTPKFSPSRFLSLSLSCAFVHDCMRLHTYARTHLFLPCPVYLRNPRGCARAFRVSQNPGHDSKP